MKELSVLQRMIERNLEKYIVYKEPHPKRIYDAMRYSLMAGGKRLRPAMFLMTAKICGLSYKNAMPAACSLEMIHTYSLIHDDLPAMDNDDLRRGKPTNHKKFDEATAVLAGDALLTRAFEILLAPAKKSAVKTKNAAAAAGIIAKAAGSRGMIGGQMADMIYEKKKADKKALDYIHRHKTGALITASVEAAAVLAGDKPANIRNFRKYGEKIGLAFQIIDDILDRTGDPERLGKTKGKDKKSGKTTYLSLYGMETSAKEASKLILEAKKYLSKINRNTEKLEKLAEYFISRTY